MTWLLPVAAIAPVLWVVAWWLIRPRLKYRLHEPRESRLHRRQRLAALYTDHAVDILDDGYPRDALAWARRAYRLDSKSPKVLVTLGEVEFDRERTVVAREWFHRAHRINLDEASRKPNSRSIGETAYALARCHGVLAADARDVREQDRHEDECLRWLQKAIEYDGVYSRDAEKEVAFSEIRPAVAQVVAGASLGGDWLAC